MSSSAPNIGLGQEEVKVNIVCEYGEKSIHAISDMTRVENFRDVRSESWFCAGKSPIVCTVKANT